MSKLPLVSLGALALAAGAAGCGSASPAATHATPAAHSSSGSSTGASASASAGAPASHVVSVATNPSGALMFSMTTLHALAGRVTIHFTNRAPEGHNFTLQAPGGRVIAATPTFTGGSRTLTLKLKPGTYTFYCSVPGHRQSGMQGTLTVT
jgi:plastocyanin